MQKIGMIYRHRRLITLSLLLLCIQSVDARDKIVMTCSQDISSDIIILGKQKMTQAFVNLGLDFDYKIEPQQRALHSAQSGASDGVCGRPFNLSTFEDTTNLIRVEAPIVAGGTIGVWSANKGKTLKDFFINSVTPNYPVGYLKGNLITKNLLESFGTTKTIALRTVSSGVKMTLAGRISYFVGDRFTVEPIIIENNLKLYYLGDIKNLNYYPYLNIKKSHLAEPLARELKLLKPIELPSSSNK